MPFNEDEFTAMIDIDSLLLLRLIQMEVPTMTRKAMQEKYAEAIKEMFIATGDDIDVCFDDQLRRSVQHDAKRALI